jgi:Fe-S-cluster formation regulator IscX/YfhJ
MGAELFHADSRIDRQTDKRTDMTKLRVELSNFSNAPKKNMSQRETNKYNL